MSSSTARLAIAFFLGAGTSLVPAVNGGLQADVIHFVGNQSDFIAPTDAGYADGNNWLNFRVPTTGDEAIFDADFARNLLGGLSSDYIHFGEYTTRYQPSPPVSNRTIPAVAATPNAVRVFTGHWTFDFAASRAGRPSGSLQVATPLQVEYRGGGSLNPTTSLTFVNGTVTTAGAQVGNPAGVGGRGNVTVQGKRASWRLETTERDDLSVANGDLIIKSGARVTVNSGTLAIGRGSNVFGQALVSGSTLTKTANLDGEIIVGFEGGRGQLTVTQGGLVDTPNPVNIGWLPGSEGRVDVVGVGSSLRSLDALTVGVDSLGRLNATDRATISSAAASIGVGRGADGNALVSASRWGVGDSMTVGGRTVDSGGTGSISVTNNGLVTIGNELTVNDQGAIHLNSGGRIVVGAGTAATVPANTLRIGSGGSLSGSGVIDGNVQMVGGFLFPGSSPGVLRIDGDFEQTAGTLLFEIGGLTPGIDFDQLQVSGDVSLSGNVVLSFINGFIPSSADRFDIIHALGGFADDANYRIFGLPPGFGVDAQFHAGALEIAVIQSSAVPEPSGLIMVAGAGLVAAVRLARRREKVPGR